MKDSPPVIVFLGPSLPVREARTLLQADYRPPARQGDVFKAIDQRPEVIVLIDGVFESAPAVWHHELLAAHAAGIAVLGASSMGALRAAELPGVVRPVGEIARRYVRGVWNDDAAVALLHAPREDGYRALTVPWVNVWATAQAARRAKVLTPAEALALCAAAEAQFYQSRTWRSVFAALRWPETRAAAVLAQAVNLKAEDARACLRAAAALPRSRRAAEPSRLSSFVRRTRLVGQGRQSGAGAEGVKTLLLADFARQAGIRAPLARVKYWRARLGGAFGADQLASWAEALALEELVLRAPERFVSDGPSAGEGAALLRALGPEAAERRRRGPGMLPTP